MNTHPQIRELEAIMRSGLLSIAQGVALEPQLAKGERRQARAMVWAAVRQHPADLRDWVDRYEAAGPMVSAAQVAELQAMFDEEGA